MKKLIIFLFLICTCQVMSQLTCDPDTTNCDWPDSTQWISGSYDLQPLSDCQIDYEYQFVYCQDQIYIRYRDIQIHGTCAWMQDFSIYHYNISSVTELLDILVIGDHDDSGNMAVCPNSNQIVKSYTASCGIWVKCSYEIKDGTRECDTGYDPPYPDYDENGTKKVDVYKWQPCGETCCEKTYTVCLQPDATGSGYDVRIENLEKRQIGICTENDSNNDPGHWQGTHGKYDKECENGC